MLPPPDFYIPPELPAWVSDVSILDDWDEEAFLAAIDPIWEDIPDGI